MKELRSESVPAPPPVVFPTAHETSGQETRAEDASVAERPERPAILLVDDDVDSRELLAQLLEYEGYAVMTARDGADALSKLTASAPPRLIILDLNMPELDGAGFAHCLLRKPTFGRVPLLVVSGSVTGRQQATWLGADAFLPKPVQHATLLEQVVHLLEQG